MNPEIKAIHSDADDEDVLGEGSGVSEDEFISLLEVQRFGPASQQQILQLWKAVAVTTIVMALGFCAIFFRLIYG